MSTNNEQRTTAIREFVDASKAFDYCVQQDYPAGLLDWVPPGIPDAWSIRAHLVHVLDADLMLHHRIRFAIAQPGTTIQVWDEEAWHRTLGYEQQNATVALSMLRMLRSVTGSLLSNLPDALWDNALSIHPKKGPMTLLNWLDMYTGHIKTHLDYVHRNEAAWNEAGCQSKGCS